MSAIQQLEIDGIPHPEPKENGSLALMRIVEKLALDPTADANKLAVLLDVKLKWEADEARKAFELAFQQFKRNLPVILKGKHVTFPTKSGGETDYWHAELDKAAPIIQEALLSYGIDQSWETGDVGGRTTVTCVLKGFGHTERASTLSGPPDTSGGKNSIQAIGSTTTYLQRYTLFASCGIVPKGSDDDGRTEGLPEETIQDYCIAMQDTSNFLELKPIFGECWGKAKAAKDSNAQDRFRKVYEQRKKDFRQ
jgi:hypothetical protein